MSERETTGEGTHRAIQKGYARHATPEGLFEVIEPGQIVPAGNPVSKLWMQPAAEPWAAEPVE
jgi:hypothetical protein